MPDSWRSISRNVDSLKTLDYLYYEHWTDQQKYFYVNEGGLSWTACSTLCLRDFIPKEKEFLECLIQQGSKYNTISDSPRKIILAPQGGLQLSSVSVKSVNVYLCV